MAIRKVIQIGDDILRKKCFAVTEMTKRTLTLLDDMKDTIKKEEGAGLAAPQVGVLKRIAVVDVKEGYFEFINPEIIFSEGSQKGVEGCLSVVNRHGMVVRPERVTVKALDRYMKPITIEAEGFFARAICHELDHLDGILYVDKATDMEDDE